MNTALIPLAVIKVYCLSYTHCFIQSCRWLRSFLGLGNCSRVCPIGFAQLHKHSKYLLQVFNYFK